MPRLLTRLCWAFVIATGAASGFASAADEVQVIVPRDKVLVRVDTLVVTGRAPQGVTISWSVERPSGREEDSVRADWGNLFEIFVLLEPGLNRVRVEDQRLEVFYDSGGLAVPPGFRLQQVHAGDVSGCDDCHVPLSTKLQDGGYPAVCVACHVVVSVNPENTVDAEDDRHFRIAVAECGRCHEAHTSNDPQLMRKTEQALCGSCHANQVGGADTHPAYDEGGCSACHDPHYSGYPYTLHEPLPGLCQRCHKQGVGEGQVHSPLVRAPSCSLCHAPHAAGSDLLRSPAADLCSECHAGILDRGHRDELNECGACHDPHGVLGSGLFSGAVAGTCAECHEGIGEGKTAHEALDEGCEACHDPHSDADTAGAQASCPECHNPRENTELSSLHGNLDLKPATCALCHHPHASDLDKLLRGSLHYPLAQGKCSSCHGGGEERSVVVVDVASRCRMCHTFEAALRERRARLHGPVSEGNCTSCHDPHLSNWPALLRAPEKQTCRECHDVAKSGDGRSLHAPVENCTKCHDPHGGDRDQYLSAAPPELCLGCHNDPRASLGEIHPALEEGCLVCHDPHEGSTPGLLKGEGRHSVCLDCHDSPLKGKKNIHAAVSRGCTECHDPHVSPNAQFLRSVGNELCRRCHNPETHRHVLGPGVGAKYPGAAAFPRDGAQYACLACHSPHASNEDHLYPRPAGDLCVACHKMRY